MSLEQQLRDTLKKHVTKDEEYYSIVCKVDEVEGGFCDCTPINGDAQLVGVRLRAGSSSTGFLPVPAVGSVVVVSFLDKEEAFVSMFSALDSVAIRGEEKGGVPVAEDLTKSFNALEDKMREVITAVNGLGGAVPPFTDRTKESDISNEKVKHG